MGGLILKVENSNRMHMGLLSFEFEKEVVAKR